MIDFEVNFYARWREQGAGVFALREGAEIPPERLLQAIWFHQRLLRDQLVAADGRRVEVLHPGFWNRESGPDFRDAILRFGSEPPRSGDVEVDLHSSGWRSHGHDTNPAFRNVILHVVWEHPPSTRSTEPARADASLAVLPVQPFLDAPIEELGRWLGGEAASLFPEVLEGQCCAPLRDLTPARLAELLQHAALVRLQSKAARFQARARQAGWEQALWEGLFRALGYKQNLWPMQRLAELRPRLARATVPLTPLAWQARLLGVGGLLPGELTRAQATTDAYLRCVWDAWWRECEVFADCQLPRSLWRFSGLRPANHPQRRLALAAHWLAAGDLAARLETWCLASVAEADLVASLQRALPAPEDDFWSWHWTLRSRRMAKAQPLLGAPRVTDLAVNVVLPWLWMRAVEGRNETLRRELTTRYLTWPPGEDNAVLRLARQRLIGQTSAKLFSTAAAQQGLMQIVRDFCEHSNALCEACRFPDLVRNWRG